MGGHKTPQKHASPCAQFVICVGDRSVVPRDCRCFHDLPIRVCSSTLMRDHVPIGARCYPPLCG